MRRAAGGENRTQGLLGIPAVGGPGARGTSGTIVSTTTNNTYKLLTIVWRVWATSGTRRISREALPALGVGIPREPGPPNCSQLFISQCLANPLLED